MGRKVSRHQLPSAFASYFSISVYCHSTGCFKHPQGNKLTARPSKDSLLMYCSWWYWPETNFVFRSWKLNGKRITLCPIIPPTIFSHEIVIELWKRDEVFKLCFIILAFISVLFLIHLLCVTTAVLDGNILSIGRAKQTSSLLLVGHIHSSASWSQPRDQHKCRLNFTWKSFYHIISLGAYFCSILCR